MLASLLALELEQASVPVPVPQLVQELALKGLPQPEQAQPVHKLVQMPQELVQILQEPEPLLPTQAALLSRPLHVQVLQRRKTAR